MPTAKKPVAKKASPKPVKEVQTITPTMPTLIEQVEVHNEQLKVLLDDINGLYNILTGSEAEPALEYEKYNIGKGHLAQFKERIELSEDLANLISDQVQAIKKTV